MEIVDFDWDKFEAEGKELEQRMRAVVVELDRQQAASRASRTAGGHSLAREQPPPGNAWDGRLDRFERMLTETLNTVTVLQHDVRALQHDVGGLKGDVAAIREQMAVYGGRGSENGGYVAVYGGVGLRTEVMLPPDRANASYRPLPAP